MPHVHEKSRGEQGCESCHGPQEHVEAGGDKEKILNRQKGSARRATRARLHDRATHALWTAAARHAASGLPELPPACTIRGRQELKQGRGRLCGQCHQCRRQPPVRFKHAGARGQDAARRAQRAGSSNVSCSGGPTSTRAAPLRREARPSCGSRAGSESCTTARSARVEQRPDARGQAAYLPALSLTSRHPPTVYEGYLLQNSQNANKIFGRSCVSCTSRCTVQRTSGKRPALGERTIACATE